MTPRLRVVALLVAAWVGALGITAVTPPDASAGGRGACASPKPTPTRDLPDEVRHLGEEHPLIGTGTLWTVVPRNLAHGTQPGSWILRKQPWFRLEQGQLTIKGRRVDGGSGTFDLDLPAMESYPLDLNPHVGPGFIPSSLAFSSGGCWEVTARLGSSKVVLRLRFPDSVQEK